MDYWKEELRQYLPDIEEFLTSVLLEETHIEVVATKKIGHSVAVADMDEKSIFLYVRDEKHSTDIIVILEEEWYGLLSSIMLGIEEKTRNDTTIELLEEFAGDLSDTVIKKFESNKKESPELGEIKVLTSSELEKLLGHSEYFSVHMEIEGIADDPVRAGCLFGDPEAQLQKEEPEEEEVVEEESTDQDPEKQEKQAPEAADFSSIESEEIEDLGSTEEVISARHIEFAEFGESPTSIEEGDHNIDLLKDVELDVSVELGRIELPLGKVLQLAKGSVIELEKLAGEPVDILVNGRQIAHGEVVVIDEHFGVRISNLITTRKHLAGLQNGS